MKTGGRHPRRSTLSQLAQVILATVLVAGSPVAVVWWLRASEGSTPLVSLLVGVTLSLLVSHTCRLLWEKRPGSEDLLFSELMIWGYLHRWRTQRRLASARNLVGPIGERQSALDDLGLKKRARLLERLVGSMETRDPYLHGHSRRVARHSWMIAKRLGLSRAEVARVRTAAAIHDLGKVKTPTAILHKPGALTDDEYRVIKRHPGDGAVMASVLKDKELVAMVLHHHERIDGSGYPARLGGEEIPLGARIIAVADTFDAITSARPYRAASAHKKAMVILREESGTRLDADVVKAFCDHYAGRGPLTLWSLLASLPERIVSWLGGSVASVASAAKVVAVTALVAGAAVTSSTLGLPAHGHPQDATLAAVRRAPASGVLAGVPHAPGMGTGAQPRVAPAAIHRSSARLPRAAGVKHAALPATGSARGGQAQVSTGSLASAGGEQAGTGPQASGPVLEATKAGTEEASAKKPGKVKEVPEKGKSEEAPGKTKGKSEEAPGKTKGKSEEAPGKTKGKSEEAPGKTKGKSEEAPGKTKGKSEEAPGKTKGKSEEAPGKAKGKSEQAPGRTKAEETAQGKHEENAGGHEERPQKAKGEEGSAGGVAQQGSGKGNGAGSVEGNESSSTGKKEGHAEKGK